MDETGIVLSASGPIEKISGFLPAELIGTQGFGFIHPDDLESVKIIFKKDLLNRDASSSSRAEFRLRHKNGSWIAVSTF
jgi:PAS domain S-box-containing protein